MAAYTPKLSRRKNWGDLVKDPTERMANEEVRGSCLHAQMRELSYSNGGLIAMCSDFVRLQKRGRQNWSPQMT